MSDKKTTLFWSRAAALLLVLGILIAINVIIGGWRWRADLTEEKLYTLSQGTRELLTTTTKPVTFKLYYSRSHSDAPMPLKQYAGRVEDLLQEYVAAADGTVTLETYDPEPDSDEEEWAMRYGLSGQSLGGFGGENFYFGLVAVSGAKEAALPFMAPAIEPQLEYLLTRMVDEVTRTRENRVGVMSSLPVMGTPAQPYMGGQGGQPAWMIVSELRKLYEVQEVKTSAETIPEEVNVLVLIHPRNLSERTIFALDQFVLRGGRLLAFVDPACLTEQEMSGNRQFGMMDFSSDLNRLTEAWGLSLIENGVVADVNTASSVSFGNGRAEPMPTWLTLTEQFLNSNDIASASLEMIMMPTPGGFTGEAAESLEMEILAETSADAATVDPMAAGQPGIQKMRDAVSRGTLPLVLRLTGTFHTAFPEGPPTMEANEKGDETPSVQGPVLTTSTEKGLVILVSDVDLIYDRFAVNTMNTVFGPIHQPMNDNLNLAMNLVEQLTGSEYLIGLRSRGVARRPFDKVLELEREAQQRWQEEELKLMTVLEETQARLAELQRARQDGQEFILSPEQQEEVEKFREQRFEVQRQLKEVRKRLREDIEQLGLKVKLVNIGLVPLLVALYGIIHGLRRRRRCRH